MDRIFDTAADLLSLPALLDFLYCLLHASGAELAARGQPDPVPPQTEPSPTNQLKATVENLKEGIVKAAKRGLASVNGGGAHKKLTPPAGNTRSSALFLDR